MDADITVKTQNIDISIKVRKLLLCTLVGASLFSGMNGNVQAEGGFWSSAGTEFVEGAKNIFVAPFKDIRTDANAERANERAAEANAVNIENMKAKQALLEEAGLICSPIARSTIDVDSGTNLSDSSDTQYNTTIDLNCDGSLSAQLKKQALQDEYNLDKQRKAFQEQLFQEKMRADMAREKLAADAALKREIQAETETTETLSRYASPQQTEQVAEEKAPDNNVRAQLVKQLKGGGANRYR